VWTRKFAIRGPPTRAIDAYVNDGCYRSHLLFKHLALNRRANEVFATMEATKAPMWSIVEPNVSPKKLSKRFFMHTHPLLGGLIGDAMVELSLALWLGLFSAQEIRESTLVAAIVFALRSDVDPALRKHFFESVLDSHQYFGLFDREALKIITNANPETATSKNTR
jgi:hypothetical protein